MVSSTATTATIIGSSLPCTNQADGIVTITVPQSGRVVIHAQVWIRLDHTSATADEWNLNIGTTSTDCAGLDGPWSWRDEIPASATTDNFVPKTAFLQRTVTVGAGTYSFYVNGLMTAGAGSGDTFWFSNMEAVFYPG